MKYIVQVEIDPETGVDVEANPAEIQEILGKWQALNPIGMYFYTDRRAMTIILDLPNEDPMFEALHATWAFFKTYPDISAVVDEHECWQSAQVGQIRTREDYYYEELRGSSLRVLL